MRNFICDIVCVCVYCYWWAWWLFPSHCAHYSCMYTAIMYCCWVILAYSHCTRCGWPGWWWPGSMYFIVLYCCCCCVAIQCSILPTVGCIWPYYVYSWLPLHSYYFLFDLFIVAFTFTIAFTLLYTLHTIYITICICDHFAFTTILFVDEHCPNVTFYIYYTFTYTLFTLHIYACIAVRAFTLPLLPHVHYVGFYHALRTVTFTFPLRAHIPPVVRCPPHARARYTFSTRDLIWYTLRSVLPHVDVKWLHFVHFTTDTFPHSHFDYGEFIHYFAFWIYQFPFPLRYTVPILHSDTFLFFDIPSTKKKKRSPGHWHPHSTHLRALFPHIWWDHCWQPALLLHFTFHCVHILIVIWVFHCPFVHSVFIILLKLDSMYILCVSYIFVNAFVWKLITALMRKQCIQWQWLHMWGRAVPQNTLAIRCLFYRSDLSWHSAYRDFRFIAFTSHFILTDILIHYSTIRWFHCYSGKEKKKKKKKEESARVT